MMQRHPEWRVLNYGKGGSRTDRILDRVDAALAPKPNVVIVLAGINDLYQLRKPEHAIEHLQKIYEKIAAAHVRIMVCTIMPTRTLGDIVSQRIDTVNAWIRAYAPAHELGLCDLNRLMEDPKNPGEIFDNTDGVHLTVAGYRRMGETVSDCVEHWLGPVPTSR